MSPWWSRSAPLRAFADVVAPVRKPPVVVLSLPRSGSSWVGEVLGGARDALYLREPLNQVHLARGGERTLFDVAEHDPPDSYLDAARRAFGAWPDFPEQSEIVQFEEQWSLGHRRHARVVVKEVNPLALGWLVRAYAPRLLLLVRHPAAVTLSFKRLGWFGAPDDPRTGPLTLDAWRRYGDRLGEVLTYARTQLRPEHRVVIYEELCVDPLTAFRELVEWAGLTWDADLAASVTERSAGGDRSAAYETQRESAALPDAWRGRLTEDERLGLRAGWSRHDLPWYAADEDW